MYYENDIVNKLLKSIQINENICLILENLLFDALSQEVKVQYTLHWNL